MKALVYHNGRCSNSRGVLSLLDQLGIAYQIKNYLIEPMTDEELLGLSALCKIPLEAMIRTKEEEFGPYKNQKLSQNEWAKIIVKHPVLLQRPIVINNKQGIIARPPEKVLEIL